MASSVQTIDYTQFQDDVVEAIRSGAAEYQPPENDKFSFAMVAPQGQVLLRGKVSEKTQDMIKAAIGKAKQVIKDGSDKNLVASVPGGLCYVLCCMIPCTVCCGAPLRLMGAVPVEMDDGQIGSFAVAGANDPRRDREMAVKALKAAGFSETDGIFSPPAKNETMDRA